MEFPVQLKAYAERVDRRLAELLPPASTPPAELGEAMRYSALAPGKRLRPALAMAAAEALGESSDPVLDAACAVEMVHAFSLIHDDLPAIDNDDLRRGRPTCHVVYGEAVAILAGDALFSLAFSTMAHLATDAERVVAAMRTLTGAANRLVAGETLDVLSEGKPVDAATLAQIHTEKTGALIAAATEIGGIVGGGTPGQIAALKTYGERVGLAFQIADDILNETGTPEQLGKASGSDRERQKATYPALYGLDASRKAALDAAAEGVAVLEALPSGAFLAELARFSVSRLN
ncbi:MAG: polyprenyl synthetase family protein [Fimbriimonas sp.]